MDETRFPTVEGALLEAIRLGEMSHGNVSACQVEVCSRASRTDKGVHALASAVCLRITRQSEGDLGEGERPFCEVVGECLPEDIQLVQEFDISDSQFNARFACQKREYWYYVPYEHLLEPEEAQVMAKLLAEGMSSEHPFACCVWISGLPESTTEQQLIELVINQKTEAELLDVKFSRKDCSAKLSFASARSALELCWTLDGAEGPPDAKGYRSPLLALPESIMHILQEVHKRLRSSLKKLTGTRSFHNFSPGFSGSLDPKSIRSVYRCRSGVTSGFKDFLSSRAFAVLRITGRDFLYHQIPGFACNLWVIFCHFLLALLG